MNSPPASGAGAPTASAISMASPARCSAVGKSSAHCSAEATCTSAPASAGRSPTRRARSTSASASARERRSEEHTSELQSQSNLVCRLLLEKKKRLVNERSGGGQRSHQRL